MTHGWELTRGPEIPDHLVRDYILPVIRAIPPAMARRLGHCRIALRGEAEPGVTSRWTAAGAHLEVTVIAPELEDHDVAMELLLCLGQALWENLTAAELREFWTLLDDEIGAGIEGDIDEQALEEKRSLMRSRSNAASLSRLEAYGRASFAGTVAEYVHCFWHDVTVRTGPDYLPERPLRRRLEMLARWFPPGRGYRLFPRPRIKA